jgi:hypothetical protein
MVDAFGFRPFGRGSYGTPAPFGFAPQVSRSPAGPPIDETPGNDVPNVIPVGKKFTLWCQNITCGAPTGGVVYPLCPSCNDRLRNGGPPIRLENGQVVTRPIVPDD